MTLPDLKLHIAKALWAGFKTEVTWDELDDHNRERYLYHASSALQGIWDAGCEVVPRVAGDLIVDAIEEHVDYEYSGDGIWSAMLDANPLRRQGDPQS